jgi:hypothetical protein
MVKKAATAPVIVVLVGGGVVFSGCRHRSPEGKAAFMIDYVAEALDLTKDQRVRLVQSKDEILASSMAMHSRNELLCDGLMAQRKSGDIDRQRVNELIAQHRAGMDETIDLVVDRVIEFRRTLPPEQRERSWLPKQANSSAGTTGIGNDTGPIGRLIGNHRI